MKTQVRIRKGDMKVSVSDGRLHYSFWNGHSWDEGMSAPYTDYFVDALHENYVKIGEGIYREKK